MLDISRLKAGDIIGFSGGTWLSAVINLLTYGIPYWNMSHVGIIAEWDGTKFPDLKEFPGRHSNRVRLLFLFESLINKDAYCEIQQEYGSGTRAIKPWLCFRRCKGKIWHYPLSKSLTPLESRRLTRFLFEHLGTGYDAIGGFRSAGVGFSWLESRLRKEDLTSLFCSEYCAAAHAHLGLLDTRSASRWNPNLLVRRERKQGILLKPRRLK